MPFLVAIPLLADTEGSIGAPLILALLKGVAAFTAIWLIGRRRLPRLLHGITRTASRELFTLTVLFLALATAWLTQLFGPHSPWVRSWPGCCSARPSTGTRSRAMRGLSATCCSGCSL